MILRQENAARLTRIRQAMTDRGLDALLVYSWKRGQVRYVSGYAPNYVANVAAVVIPHHRDPTLLIRFPFDLERARAMCWFDDVRASGNVSALGRDAVSRLRELRLDRGRIGLVTGDNVMDELPYTLYRQLRQELPDARFTDARQLVMDLRKIKSAAEFDLLKRSANVADAAAAAAAAALAPGVSEYSVVAAAEAAARRARADDWLVVIASRGAQELVGPPEEKAIAAQATVILEVAVQVSGYWTQVARTYAVGGYTRQQRTIYDAAQRAYLASVEAACPGKTLGMVSQAATDVMDTAGHADHAEHDMGHCIGLDLPEPPRVEMRSEELVRAGMVIVLHPAIRVPGVGGAFVGGTVLVSEDGPVAIHTIPRELT